MSEPVSMRGYNDQDLNFILQSWLLGDKKQGKYFGIRSTLYFKEREKEIRKLLLRAGALVVYPKSSPSTIIGWMCAETFDLGGATEGVVHFMYVKKEFRRFGVGSAMYKELAKQTSLVPWSSTPLIRAFNMKGKAVLEDMDKPEGNKSRKHVIIKPKILTNYPTAMYNAFKNEYNPFILDKLNNIQTRPIRRKTKV